MQELKSVQKSVRLTEKVYKAIDGYRGTGFNEKLGNLVEDFLYQRDGLVRDWNMLQAQISDKRVELRQIRGQVEKVRNVDVRMAALVDAILTLLPGV